jgi:hypothetical protein
MCISSLCALLFFVYPILALLFRPFRYFVTLTVPSVVCCRYLNKDKAMVQISFEITKYYVNKTHTIKFFIRSWWVGELSWTVGELSRTVGELTWKVGELTWKVGELTWKVGDLTWYRATRSLFVLLYFFFWPLCCLFFFNLRILIISLVSSKSSCC